MLPSSEPPEQERDFILSHELAKSVSFAERSLFLHGHLGRASEESLMSVDVQMMRYTLLNSLHRAWRFLRDATEVGLVHTHHKESLEDFADKVARLRNAFEHLEDVAMKRPIRRYDHAQMYDSVIHDMSISADATSDIIYAPGKARFGNLLTTDEIRDAIAILTSAAEGATAEYRKRYYGNVQR